jgi:ribosomal-protein-alanine N-acetyltransferase
MDGNGRGVNPDVDTPGPGSRIEFVPAAWRDLGALRDLERECFPKDAWPLWDLIGVLTLPHMVRFKALHGEQMVGFIAADCRPREQVAWIATVAVLPDYRRLGIGRRLMQAAEQEIPQSAIRLCVRISNQGAQELYRQLDYTTREIWERYYHDGEDALVMEKIRLSGESGYNTRP